MKLDNEVSHGDQTYPVHHTNAYETDISVFLLNSRLLRVREMEGN